jgi:hypothetical protein
VCDIPSVLTVGHLYGVDNNFTLEELNFEFLFYGECSIQGPENIPGVKKMEFRTMLKNNGTMLGNLELTLIQNDASDQIQTYFNNVFNLTGLDNRTGLSVSMENCFIRKWDESSDKVKLTAEFLPADVFLVRTI